MTQEASTNQQSINLSMFRVSVPRRARLGTGIDWRTVRQSIPVSIAHSGADDIYYPTRGVPGGQITRYFGYHSSWVQTRVCVYTRMYSRPCLVKKILPALYLILV
jgi:hypothetical protein